MNRGLRVVIVIVAALVIAGSSFTMGFGSALVLGGFMGQASTTTSLQQARDLLLLTPVPGKSNGATSNLPGVDLTPVVPAAKNASVRDVQARFNVFWEALSKLVDNFYDQQAVDAQKIVYGAIKGMVDTLDDPHTYFSPPEQLQQSREDLEGAFEGIGATIELKDGHLQVVAPISGTPADRAGIKPGDWIVRIDGQDTSGLTVNEGVSLIRGKKGTPVVLTLLRDGVKDPFDITVVRDVINVPNVKLTMLDGGIAHIQLVNLFTATLGEDLKKTLQDAKQRGATKIILDVRGNPGGYLQTAVQVASQFLKDGIVASESSRDGRKTDIPVIRGGLATDMPIVVLANKGSASASEIVAGAIQDSGRGPLIGETTYGKGSVQQDFPLSDGSAVHITVANWLTPSGRNISKQGLTPNIQITISDDDAKAGRDTQLERAIEYLKTGK